MNALARRTTHVLALLAALAMVFGLAACGSGSSSNGTTATASSPAPSSESGETPEVIKGSNDRILITYFSKTGTTQQAAEQIQELTGGATFRIEAEQAYPEEYQPTTEVAREELDENARPAVKGTVEDMDQYDTIFVGYPIWWGEPPMPVLTFLESYDLSGKTIVPFCTAISSSLEGSLDMLESSAKGATFLEGLRVTSDDQIQPWLEQIGVLQ